jgi:hypothetical protein
MSLEAPGGNRTRSLTPPMKLCLIRGCGIMTTYFQRWHWRLWANGVCSMQDARMENGWRSVVIDGEHGRSIVSGMTNARPVGENGAKQIREQRLLSF